MIRLTTARIAQLVALAVALFPSSSAGATPTASTPVASAKPNALALLRRAGCRREHERGDSCRIASR